MKSSGIFLRSINSLILVLVVGAVLTCAPAFAATSAGENALSRETRREINRARRATARYHNIENAVADGYMDINVFIPNMGYHYLKPAILDAHFDAERPELLVYADFGSGYLHLVAVEYAVPTALADTPPEGFTGASDHWTRNDEFNLWTLHAWIWQRNPNGVFAELNPMVP